MQDKKLFIKIEQNIEVCNSKVYLQDVAKMYSADCKMLHELNKTELLQIKAREDMKYTVSIMKVIELIQKKYPKLNICGYYSPPLGFEKNEEQLDKAIETIKQSEADILIVFLGCPKQEKFIAKYKDRYQVPVSITMGGCIDFIGADIKRAPMWMQKSGLEWFFRFSQEPKRLFKRYFIDDSKIFPLVLKYKLGLRK